MFFWYMMVNIIGLATGISVNSVRYFEKMFQSMWYASSGHQQNESAGTHDSIW